MKIFNIFFNRKIQLDVNTIDSPVSGFKRFELNKKFAIQFQTHEYLCISVYDDSAAFMEYLFFC